MTSIGRIATALLVATCALLTDVRAQFGGNDLGIDAKSSEPVQIRAVPQFDRVLPNGQFAVAVVIDIAEKHKIWPTIEFKSEVDPEVAMSAIWSRIDRVETATGDEELVDADPSPGGGRSEPLIDGNSFFRIGEPIWPAPQKIKVPLGGPVPVDALGYKAGQHIIYIPILVEEAAPAGEHRFVVDLFYQACDEGMCFFPKPDSARMSVEVDASGAAVTPLEPKLFENFDPSVFAEFGVVAESSKEDTVKFNVFGWEREIGTAGLGFVLLLLLAALGGFLLNLTPCVLPVIPLKIMGMSQSAGSRGRTFFLGAVMSAGVVAFWIAIAIAISSLENFNQVNALFQTTSFTIGIGVFIAIMAIGMFGVFSTGLPQWVYRITPKHDSATGSFGWGILTAVLSTPCTAPFMGASIAWAAKQGAGDTVITFAAIGFGMAIPYLILSANPKWVSKVPRSGPSSVLVKQAMGVFLLAVAAFFIGSGVAPLLRESEIDPVPQGFWWIVFGLVGVGFLFVAYRGISMSKSGVAKGALAVVAVFGVLGSISLGSSLTSPGPVDWTMYTPDRYSEASANDRTLVTDFTAEWCLNCKALEKAILYTDAVSDVLNSDEVTAFKVDLTKGNDDGRAALSGFGHNGIPLLVIDGPGVPEPILLGDGYTVDVVLDAIWRASQGRAGKSASGAESSGSEPSDLGSQKTAAAGE